MEKLEEEFFWFLRHGYAAHNLQHDTAGTGMSVVDPPLVNFGKTQVQMSGREMAERGYAAQIKYVICSPSDRTLETARLFLEAAGFKGTVIVDPRVAGRMDLRPENRGALTKEELTRKYADDGTSAITFDFSLLPEGVWGGTVETPEDFARRIKDFSTHYFDKLKYPPAETLVVSHDGWIIAFSGVSVFSNGSIAQVAVSPAAAGGGNVCKVIYTPPTPPNTKKKDLGPKFF